MDVTKLFFDSASDLAKQLIAVSTGVLGLSITFLKDVVKVTPGVSFGPLRWCWFLYLTSIVCGFWTLMAVTGSIGLLLQNKDSTPVIDNIKIPAGAQIILFIAATICLVLYGLGAIKKLAEQPKPPPKRKGSVE
jgi:hypothetical protein